MGLRGTALPLLCVGALAGCPTVDLGDTPTGVNLCNPAGGRDYFVAEIWPTFIKGPDQGNPKSCTQNRGCHVEGDGQFLNFRVAPVDDAFNFRQAQNFLECGNESMSLLLTKPLANIDAHVGGDLFMSMTEQEVDTFLGWF